MILRPAIQVYEHYTDQDFLVWKTLVDRQMMQLKKYASASYLNALTIVNFSAEKIPDFSDVNATLLPLTGWSLHVVPHISPQKDFFEFLSKKKFTATCWLRTMAQLDYIEEPDMFHDVFAHVPLLSNPAYCHFFKGISDIALEFHEDPLAIELLGRMYWFTIEFGLIRENGSDRIYGAGIISSSGETKHCLHVHVPKYEFNVEQILASPYRTDQLQEKYFVIQSFGQLYDSLPEIRRLIKTELEAQRSR